MVKIAGEYPWSSYGMYIGNKEEDLITSNKILAYFLNDNDRELYKNYVESSVKVPIILEA